jgi:hypothetical protein
MGMLTGSAPSAPHEVCMELVHYGARNFGFRRKFRQNWVTRIPRPLRRDGYAHLEVPRTRSARLPISRFLPGHCAVPLRVNSATGLPPKS